MLIACWSVKGGSGTTVVASSLALLLSRSSESGAVLADLGGDVPAACGLAELPGPGLLDFVAAGPDVPFEALDRLETRATDRLRVLPAGGAGSEAVGRADPTAADGERLAEVLSTRYGSTPVVVDCGPPGARCGLALAAAASLSLLVLRPCYLALRRAAQTSMRPSAVVLVTEAGRSLGAAEVSDVLGVPVRAEIPYDPAIARIVDAGLLINRIPRSIERALRVAA